ncbi:hypothetical protein R6Q57_003074 [Mikania cordata]
MEHTRMETLVGLETMQHRGYDRDILQQLGRVDEFDAIMTPQWAPLLRCSWLHEGVSGTKRPGKEIVIEDNLLDKGIDSEGVSGTKRPGKEIVIEDNLLDKGRQTHTMSVAQFAVAFGLYTQEQVTAPDFEGLLRGFTRAARPGYITEEDLSAYWKTISTQPNTDPRLAFQIRDLFLKYIHRIVGSTLIPRNSGKDKVSSFDLFCLYCIQGRHPENLATIILASFTASSGRPHDASGYGAVHRPFGA